MKIPPPNIGMARSYLEDWVMDLLDIRPLCVEEVIKIQLCIVLSC